ncbi:hypothetical protein P4O66_019865, partial [Electrophorus voltai]
WSDFYFERRGHVEVASQPCQFPTCRRRARRTRELLKMARMDGVVKPKTKRSKRFLQNREAKLVENAKTAMILKGGNTSETVTHALKDVYALKKPNAVLYKKTKCYSRKNIMRPFEDPTSLEFFSKKSDCSLFLFGSHNKKRPNNLIFGRMFDSHVLDMFELGVDRFSSLKDIKSTKCAEGTKPMLLFAGELFHTDTEYTRLRSVLTDFFRGPTVSAVRLAGLEHVLHFTAQDGKIYMRSYRCVCMNPAVLRPSAQLQCYARLRSYRVTDTQGNYVVSCVEHAVKRVKLKKSGCRTPRVELEEIGPAFDFVLRRTHLASDDLYKTAHRQPRGLKAKKKKNISHDTFGTKYGRLHMQKQNLDKLQTRKMKGLRKRKGGVKSGQTPPKKARTGL